MKIESITFDSINDQIIVLNDDGTSKEFKNSNQYLSKYPDREQDCISMNWPMDFPSKHDSYADYYKK